MKEKIMMMVGVHSSLRERGASLVNDIWVRSLVFSKSHNYFTKPLLTFSQLTYQFFFHISQQFFHNHSSIKHTLNLVPELLELILYGLQHELRQIPC